MIPSETSAQLRARVQQKRRGLSSLERARIETILDAKFLEFLRATPALRPGGVWAIHRPLPWEWRLPRSLEFLRQSHIRLAYPRMRDLANRQMGMAWSVVDERHAQDWRPCPGMKALLEPHELLPEVDPATFDGVWVPGVAFSERGERIGAGGGFYDTFLGQFPALFRVAVAAEFQVFSSLPDQRPDEPRMSVIVSESSVRFFDTTCERS